MAGLRAIGHINHPTHREPIKFTEEREDLLPISELAKLTGLDQGVLESAIDKGYIEAVRPMKGLVLASRSVAERYADYLRSRGDRYRDQLKAHSPVLPT